MSDYISRADAIEAVEKNFRRIDAIPISKEIRMAIIRLLKALPSADAVSRKAKCCPITETCMSIDCPVSSEYIGRPSADVVQGWIPCSERLPKEKARVLTYDTMGDVVFGQYDKGKWYWEAEACADYWAKNDGVIAWMPLPTPYKGGAE